MSHAFAQLLMAFGVTRVFGVTGGGIARFVGAVDESGLDVVHARHEGGAAFMAAEASIASGTTSVVYTTTGPGLTNSLTGLVAGAWEGARLVVVSGGTRSDLIGRGAFQETGPSAITPLSLFPPGLNHHSFTLASEESLNAIAATLTQLTQEPGGFIVHVLIPCDAQAMPGQPVTRVPPPVVEGPDEPATIRACRVLWDSSTVLWVGFGARHSAPAVRRLARHLQCRVMSTPRGKGVIPERDPHVIGVTGFGGHASVQASLEDDPPDTIIVLGSRLGEFASYWNDAYVGDATLIHVDIDERVFGQAYPEAATLGVRSDIDTFVDAVLSRVPGRVPNLSTRRRNREPTGASASASLRMGRGIHPRVLMQAIQRQVIDRSDALVLAEAGNAFAWAGHALDFDAPRYRASTSYGSMGQACAGVVGAAVSREGKAVAISGDGAMLMNNEISTAVQYGVQCVWIVLNDASYGMIRHGMDTIGVEPVAVAIPQVDFVAFARAQGADGVRVEDLEDLDEAIAQAMNAEGPFVVDVAIDPTVRPPFDGRNAQLETPERSGEWRMVTMEEDSKC